MSASPAATSPDAIRNRPRFCRRTRYGSSGGAVSGVPLAARTRRRLLGPATIEQHIDQEGERVGLRSPPVGRGDFDGVAGIRLSFAEAAGSVLQE